MQKSRVAAAVGIYGVAGGLSVFGAGLTIRQAAFMAAAVVACKVGYDIWKSAFADGPFRRFQFRIDFSGTGLNEALLDAGVYTRENLPSADLLEALPGRGRIVFTWLEPSFFYVNTYRSFTDELEAVFELRTFRNGVEEWIVLNDRLELRGSTNGYELVLTSSEQREEWPRPYQYPGLVLFHIPRAVFWSLQGSEDYWIRQKRAIAAMEGSGLEYQTIDEVKDGWDFRGKYGTFRWWPI